jgi:hypothetical protein
MGVYSLMDLNLPMSDAVFVVRVRIHTRKKRNNMTTNDVPQQLVLQQLIQGFQVSPEFS